MGAALLTNSSDQQELITKINWFRTVYNFSEGSKEFHQHGVPVQAVYSIEIQSVDFTKFAGEKGIL